jgi:hypothetical protein
VACLGHEPAHGTGAQAIGEAIDQRFRLCFAFPLGKRGLCRRKLFGGKRRERHQIDAETDVDRLDLVLEQTQEMLGLARGCAQARLDHGGRAVGAGDPQR